MPKVFTLTPDNLARTIYQPVNVGVFAKDTPDKLNFGQT
jgi:hypothetical protein